MFDESKIESTEYTDLTRVIRWFIRLRWAAAVGVFAALIIGDIFLDFSFDFAVLFSILAALLVANFGFAMYHWRIKHQNLSRREMGVFFHIQICIDYGLLFLLIYFTGFLDNPFIYFFVFHIMLTSFIFPSRTVMYYVVALTAVFLLLMILTYDTSFLHFITNLSRLDISSEDTRRVLNGLSFLSTLSIAAYLVTRIKLRIVERGKKIEIELNKYKTLDTAKSNFILQVTHELRGPLAAVKGYHEMILKGITGKVEDRTRDTLGRATRRTKNLLTMIDEMIDYAYMKSDEEIRYNRVDVDMKESIHENVELISTEAQQKDIRISAFSSRGITVCVNRDLLNIILGNLLSNAVRYSKPGGTITVMAEESGNEVHLMVKDEGIGSEEGELESIFEEFYRTRKAREVEQDGTGLGLSIIKKAVDSLHGRIVVYSEMDRGTTFHIHLPKS